jgi:hypothetical protein
VEFVHYGISLFGKQILLAVDGGLLSPQPGGMVGWAISALNVEHRGIQ